MMLQWPLEEVAISKATNCAQTMSWHQPHIPPLHKTCSSPLKHHPALPSASSSLFPAQHSGGQDKNTGVASSLLRHILASFGKHRLQAEGKASHRAGQSPHILIKLNITFTTRTKIQGVQGILKLPLVLRNSKHHQEHCLKCSNVLWGEGRGPAAPSWVPGHECRRWQASHHIQQAKTQLCKIHFRSHILASHVNESTEDNKEKIPSYRVNN